MEKNLHTLLQKGKYGLALWKAARRLIFLWRVRPWRRKKRTKGRHSNRLFLAAGAAKGKAGSAGKEIKWMGRLLMTVRKQYF
ncbi:hypothetical protein H9X85_03355 [Anaerotignum lactatifermentans]|uniref:Uncharacterized protein n=1 Tax=Anaerotignum lactatifermentans TaxID=160404 RepID=A0ABS2GBI0_9FIRM|nr:hypothetical protein [Anaerotignum lactatifermentans]MBM6828671.1 hypothetical protein [Anaerotignum lactatifermentans]MBM6878806.1 hypothetical protein [Anaerotignum lactatifermentans]MBM6950253.1 hypothetical protein [Anaerotignum lactatifermentans]